MTEQEAIEQLKCDMELIIFNPDNGEVISVECLNDLNRATYEADKVAISALEKQIPKKVIETGNKPYGGKCPCCGEILYTSFMNTNYCHWCGNKLTEMEGE